MDFFGIRMERVKKDKEGNFLKKGPHEDLGVNYAPLGSGLNTNRLDFWQRVTFPDPSKLGPFEKVAFAGKLTKFAERLLEPSFFSICEVTELMDLCSLRYTEQTWKFRTQLQHLHCINYRNIPPEILETMPLMLSAIFTEGKSLRDVSEGPAETPVLMTEVQARMNEKQTSIGGSYL